MIRPININNVLPVVVPAVLCTVLERTVPVVVERIPLLLRMPGVLHEHHRGENHHRLCNDIHRFHFLPSQYDVI